MEDATCIKKPPDAFMFFSERAEKVSVFRVPAGWEEGFAIGKDRKSFPFFTWSGSESECRDFLHQIRWWICSSLCVSFDLGTPAHLLWCLCCFHFQTRSRIDTSWRLSNRSSFSTSTSVQPASSHPFVVLPESQHAKLIHPIFHQANPCYPANTTYCTKTVAS